MFGSGMNAVSGSSGSSGLVPTRFEWPHGGSKVFLCGTFTGWAEHIQLTPVEDCPNVFQVVYGLAPGYHEYKFFVDGEWRHDERQRFVSGNYGIVNTVRVTRVPDMSSLPVPPTFPARSNMDVDNDIPMHADGILAAPVEAIEISRQRISVFLSSHTAYELLPDSGKVIALDASLPVKQAFHILYEQGVPVAPLWDHRQCQFVGVLSAMDYVLILRELAAREFFLTQEELESHTIEAWKEEKQYVHGQMDGIERSPPGRLIHVGPNDSLKDVTLKILQNKVSTVPIIHSSSPDGSFPQLLHLASLSGILKCICRHFQHSASSLPILQQHICSIPLGTWIPNIGQTSGRPLAMLKPNSSLKAALNLFTEAEVSSVPVVDDNGSLLDIYSRSDITALARDEAYMQIHIEETTIQQALQLGLDLNSPYNGQKCQICLRTDSLLKVMERLANPGVRRLVIVEAGSKRVEGIISLSDLFRFLLG